ncbi:MAG: N-acetylmuramoyl-L-alanine amidase [Phycicoccus sp.]
MNRTPHHSDRGGVTVDVFVEHYTAGAGTAESTAKFMITAGNSAHAIVDRTGDIHEAVETGRAAWHAGDHNKPQTRGSRFPTPEQLHQLETGRIGLIPIGAVPYVPRLMNRRSIGVEHVNLGWAYADKPDAVKLRHRNPASRDDDWQTYPYDQMWSSADWHNRTRVQVPTARYVTGHEDVCNADTMGDDWRTKELERVTGAKLDPGPAFPWREFLLMTKLIRVAYDFQRHGWVILDADGRST